MKTANLSRTAAGRAAKERRGSLRVDSDRHTMADFFDSDEPDILAKAEPLTAFIDDWRRKGTYTYRRLITSPCANAVTVDDGGGTGSRRLVMFASNSYLGLNTRPEVMQAAAAAIREYGTSMCGAPFLNGTYRLVAELERKLAAFEGHEAAMVFTTGYQANVGTISALLRAKDIVVIDRLCHASIVDGCRLAGCACRSFRHNDMGSLEKLLRNAAGKYRGKLIVVDGVFSMDGDLAPLPGIVELARRYGARVMVDEAHGTGVAGAGGRGVAEHFGVAGEVDIIMGTFSKSLASTGGFISASREVVEYIRHYARAYIFSASPTPANAAAALAALEILRREPELRKRLWANVRYFHGGLKDLGFAVRPDPPESAIMAVVVGSDKKLRAMSRAIHERGVFLNTVVYPAVGRKESRLRISISAEHSRDDMNQALAVLSETGEEYGIL